MSQVPKEFVHLGIILDMIIKKKKMVKNNSLQISGNFALLLINYPYIPMK